jgi:hypothetical protein
MLNKSSQTPFVTPRNHGPAAHPKVKENGFCLATAPNESAALPFVIPRACDFFRDWQFFLGTRIPCFSMNCHPDRSEAQWRDLRLILGVFKP